MGTKDGVAIDLLREHEKLDKERFDNVDDRFDTVMNGIQRIEESVEAAHHAIHESIAESNRANISALKYIALTLLSIVVALGGTVIGLLLYVWFNRSLLVGVAS